MVSIILLGGGKGGSIHSYVDSRRIWNFGAYTHLLSLSYLTIFLPSRVATSGEPYSEFQTLIRACAPPGTHVVVAAMTNSYLCPGYILPAGCVGCGCYQDRIAVMGRGALELLVVVAQNILQICTFVVPKFSWFMLCGLPRVQSQQK